MRTVERAAGSRILGAIVAQHRAVAFFDFGGGMVGNELLHPTVERDRRGREGRGLAVRQPGGEPLHRFHPQSGDRDGKFGGLMFDGIEPVRIGPRFLQQPVARAQRPFQRIDAAAMLGIDREHQPVEEAPPLRWRAGKQRVHRRNEPDHAHMIGKGRGRRDRLPVDPVFALARGVILDGALDAGAKRGEPQRALDFGGDRPRAVAFAKRDLVERRSPQAAAGRKEGNRFDQIGFAGAVRPDQHDRFRVGFERGRVVIAEIGQRQVGGSSGFQQSGDRESAPIPDSLIPDPRQTRIGIST